MTQNPDPNSFDKEIADAANANPVDRAVEGTEQKETAETGHQETDVDYKKKFGESSREAHRLLEEDKRNKARIAELESRLTSSTPTPSDSTEEFFPGFNDLDADAQQNLLAYTNSLRTKVTEEVMSNPAIAFAQKSYNETKFNTALSSVVSEYPELEPSKEEFRSMYFNPNNVPDNIGDILRSMAKSFLYDKARDMGIEEGKKLADRIELEDTTGGDRTPTARRTLADWQRLAQENPAKFAAMSKEYNADIADGLI